jgi:glycosyltransferase involved in cell wall biosynthesis
VKANKYVDAITFVSQEGLDNFQAQHKWHNTPSLVIDNGVLILPVAKKRSENLRIGSVGRMIPLKHQINLLNAIERLPVKLQSNIAVNFFGDGECLGQLKQFHQNNIANVDVNFYGMINDRELIYSNIDVLVVTSETEGLSMVIIEAMANRIPVIATDVGGNPKLVINEQTGWLFNYNDDEKLSEHIQRFIDNSHLVTRYGDSAFDFVSANFSIDTAAEKYGQLYNA